MPTMASLFRKLRTLFRARLHDAADKALQKSDLSVYDQFIRDAEKELDTFKSTIAPMYAQVKSSKRRREALATKAAKFDLMVDEYLKRGERTKAMVNQKQFKSTMDLIKTYDASLVRQVTALEQMDDVKVKLEGRLAIAKQEREELNFCFNWQNPKKYPPKR